MNKILLASILSVSLYANSNNVGCGLGSVIIEDKSSIIGQLLAVTTNGTSANQMFGISSGTLGCKESKTLASNEELEIFVLENIDNLLKDISLGKGEYLDTLATLMYIEDRELFATTLRSDFNKIVTNSNIESGQLIDNIFSVKG